MGSLEKVEELLSKPGFQKKMLPMMIRHGVLFGGIGYMSVGGHLHFGNAIFLVFFVSALIISYYARFKFAVKKHEELKNKFGKEYTDLIESGQFAITPTSILMAGMPISAARRHFKNPDL